MIRHEAATLPFQFMDFPFVTCASLLGTAFTRGLCKLVGRTHFLGRQLDNLVALAYNLPPCCVIYWLPFVPSKLTLIWDHWFCDGLARTG